MWVTNAHSAQECSVFTNTYTYTSSRVLLEVVPATDSTVGKYSRTTMQTHPEACTEREVFTRIKVRSHSQRISLLFSKHCPALPSFTVTSDPRWNITMETASPRSSWISLNFALLEICFKLSINFVFSFARSWSLRFYGYMSRVSLTWTYTCIRVFNSVLYVWPLPPSHNSRRSFMSIKRYTGCFLRVTPVFVLQQWVES